MQHRLRVVAENDGGQLRDVQRAYHQVAHCAYIPDCRVLESKVEPAHEFTEVLVTDQDTLVAAQEMVSQGLRPMVLNMASDRRPGGGYRKGSLAQEEELFRRTSLSLSLEPERHRYPLPTYAGFYSPQVAVFRGPAPMYTPLDRCFEVSVCSMAALRNPGATYTTANRDIMRRKIRAMFLLGLAKGHDALLLSAFGCGAFHNPPNEVAAIFREMVHEYQGCFREVRFAIYDTMGTNFQTFTTAMQD
jgi:uncharacterized protein (TIGR02452 family)